ECPAGTRRRGGELPRQTGGAVYCAPMHLLAATLAAALAAAQSRPAEEPAETPISVPEPIPHGFLVAWKPMILSVRIDSGVGTRFGSDKFQPFRGLIRYTGSLPASRSPPARGCSPATSAGARWAARHRSASSASPPTSRSSTAWRR